MNECWLLCSWWMNEDGKQRVVVKDISNAFSTSFAAPLCIKETTYSMKTASHGNVIGPQLGSPNSSSAILKSSLMTLFLRYTKGITKRFSSVAYTTKWPFSHTDDVLQLSASTGPVAGNEILFCLLAASFCHFFAILISFFGLIMLFLVY